MGNPIQIIQGVLLTAALTTPYAVPKQTKVKLTGIRFVNTDAVQHTVTVHIVAAGDTAGNQNVRFKTLVVPPASNGDLPPFFNMDDVMLPGTTIQAMADVPGVVAMSANGEIYP